MIILITGISASWKSTLQKALLEKWYKRPINFTTRQPRNDAEYDEYVFINKETFFKKLSNWDFFEHTVYGWNFYGVSQLTEEQIANNDYAVVVDWIWRAQIEQKLAKMWIKPLLVFLEIDRETQLSRLEERRLSVKEIRDRVLDMEWFYPTPNSLILSWTRDINTLVNLINEKCLLKKAWK